MADHTTLSNRSSRILKGFRVTTLYNALLTFDHVDNTWFSFLCLLIGRTSAYVPVNPSSWAFLDDKECWYYSVSEDSLVLIFQQKQFATDENILK